jgi:hypothetical protein
MLRASVSKLAFVNEAHVAGVASRTFLKGALAVSCAPKR